MKKKQSPLDIKVKVVNEIRTEEKPRIRGYDLSIFILPNPDNYFILVTG